MRTTVALVLSVLAIAGAVLYASESQREVADENYHEAIVARQLAADMLSRENLLHEYLLNGGTDRVVDIYELDRRQTSVLKEARELSSDSTDELATLDRQSEAAQRWNQIAQTTIGARTGGRTSPGAGLHEAFREKIVQDFLNANREYQQQLDAARVEELKAAALVPVKLIIMLSVVFGAIALGIATRRPPHRRGRARRAGRLQRRRAAVRR